MTNTIELNNSNFNTELGESEKPVIIDFYATWCGPCKRQLPIMDELAESFEGKAKVCKVNVEESSDLASKYNVSSIPALLVFKGGKLVDQKLGLHTKGQLTDLLNRYL